MLCAVVVDQDVAGILISRKILPVLKTVNTLNNFVKGTWIMMSHITRTVKRQ